MNTVLPPIYSFWMADFLPGDVPDERRSTCSDCAMCSTDSHILFEAKTKCCTYIPAIPNFLAGKILQSEVGVFDAYWDRADIRPQGVLPDAEFVQEYHPHSQGFGRNLKWRCPYYLEESGGLCGIWQSRNARCATWFCKHLRGQISKNFWITVDELLSAAEMGLSRWCMHELEVGASDFRECFPVTTEQPAFDLWMKQQSFYQKRLVYGDAGSIEFQRWTWGKWLGHEKEYFRECYSLIQPLTWKDVQLICGPSLVSKEQTALAAYAKLISDYFPEVLKLGDFHHADQENDVVRIWTSNPYDPINMSRNTFRRLHQLSGKPMTEVMQEIPTELLQKLFDSGILL